MLDRRRAPGVQRARDGLRRRARRGRVRAQSSIALRRGGRAGFGAYVAIALAGTIGYLARLDRRLGDRPLRRPAVRSSAAGAGSTSSPAKLDARRALVRPLGDWAVFLGRVTPVARSFVSIPAGVFECRCGRYTVLTASAARSGASRFAGAGWALGVELGDASTTRFRYADYADRARRSCSLRGVRVVLRRRAIHLGLAAVPPIPLVDVKAQYAPLIPELQAALRRGRSSRGTFIFGPNVEGFEREAAEYLGVAQTIGVANGTDALVLVLDALGIGPGDEVICPAFTFYATAEAIARRGATPVFADIDPATLNLDPADVARADHAADEGDHAGAPLRPPGAARGARARSACR